MKRSFGSVIIMPPSSPRVHRLHYTRTAIGLIVAACVLALFAILAARYALPRPVADMERARLERENELLKTEKRDLEMQTKKLELRVSQLEEISKRMTSIAGPH